MVCYQCRQPGHTITNCPSKHRSVEDSQDLEQGGEGVVVCYKCGSTEHALANCPRRNQGNSDDLPFATCFLCKEKGHLVSGCPQNKKGIYVNGGSCRVCGSQQHRASECPEKKKNKKGNGGNSDGTDEDVSDLLEQEDSKTTRREKNKLKEAEPKKKRRVVKF